MYTILVVDDAKDSILLLQFDLQEAGYTVIASESGTQALQIIETEQIDMVLLDLYMPNMSGLEVLQIIKASPTTEELPVIMLSASDNEDEIVAALELGAADYVTKPYISKVLLARMNTAFRLTEKTAALDQMAKKDFLTGMNNRRNFYNLATNVISLTKRHQQNLVIAMCDIDFFKRVNDQYGHEFGDDVLLEISKILTHVFRDCDIIGRIGGEEFAMCLPQTSIAEALIACERLRVNVEHCHFKSVDPMRSISITLSIGLTAFNQIDISLGELLNQADQALYQAKNTGRNKIVVFESNNKQLIVENSTVQLETLVHADYPGIDLTVGVNNVLGDEKLFEQVLGMFYEDHAQDQHKLTKAIACGDITMAKHLAHTLKGVASSIGAMLLFKAAKELDIAINQEDEHKYIDLTTQVGEKLSQVIEGIKLKQVDKIS